MKLGAARYHSEIQTCPFAKGASGSVIIFGVNLVCVCHDSPDVCMVCHVARKRSWFKGGHGSVRGRLKRELPALPTGSLCREREEEWTCVT